MLIKMEYVTAMRTKAVQLETAKDLEMDPEWDRVCAMVQEEKPVTEIMMVQEESIIAAMIADMIAGTMTDMVKETTTDMVKETMMDIDVISATVQENINTVISNKSFLLAKDI